MCINVHANGKGIFTGSHVSAYVHLMRGEYDNRLVWPFRGDVTIQLVNHNSDQDHHEWNVHFDDASDDGRVSSRVPLMRTRSGTGRGFRQFVPHAVVESCVETRRFIINDCLTFRVTKIVVHSI